MAELIHNSFDADIVIVHYREDPHGSAFFVDKKQILKAFHWTNVIVCGGSVFSSFVMKNFDFGLW